MSRISGLPAALLIQTGGTLTGTSGAQLWVGQYDQPNVNSGLYNFSGGVLNMSTYLVVGNNGGVGVMNISGSTVLNSSGQVFVGSGVDQQQSSGTLNFYGGVMNLSNWLVVGANGAMGLMNMSGSAAVQTSGELHIGDGVTNGVPSSGTLNISGNAVMNVNNWVAVGRGGGIGVVNMTGGLLTQQGNGNFLVGTGNGSQGTFYQSGGTVDAVNQLLVPEAGNSSTLGTYNLSGSGVVNANSWLAVGAAALRATSISVEERSHMPTPTAATSPSAPAARAYSL